MLSADHGSQLALQRGKGVHGATLGPQARQDVWGRSDGQGTSRAAADRNQVDYADITVDGVYAKPGMLSFKKLGLGNSWTMHPGMSHTFPRMVDSDVDLVHLVGAPASGKLAALSPARGLYDFRVIPYSTVLFLPNYSPTLPAAQLAAKLDVRQGTAAECPPATEVPWAYYRASK